MATYSILDAARIVGRTKSTVRHHIKKMPPEMVIRDGKEVRLTEDGLAMLRESVNQVTKSREPVHEPPVNHREPGHEPVQEDVEPGHDASVNQVTEDREPPVNHPDDDAKDRLRDMAHIIDNLTSERDSLQKEVNSLRERIASLEAVTEELRRDKDRYYNAMLNEQQLHAQEQRIHFQDIALLTRKRLPSGGGAGTIFDRIKNVFAGKKSDADGSDRQGNQEGPEADA